MKQSVVFIVPGIKGAMRVFVVLCLIISLFHFSCKEEQTPMVIIITQAPTVEGVAGEFVIFDIELVCEEDIISFMIDQFHPGFGSTNILDTVPVLNKFKYYYKVPYFEDSSLITLTFTAISSSYSNSVPRYVRVINNEEPLIEYSGNVFYSNLSGKPNAFVLKDLQAVFYDAQSADKPDFADNTVDSVHFNTLSKEWISPAGLMFSRLNDFNYATASEKSVKDAFSIASKYTTVKNLSSDDILIFGSSTEAKGTIRFTQIIDTDSTLDDRYIFNIKIIE